MEGCQIFWQLAV